MKDLPTKITSACEITFGVDDRKLPLRRMKVQTAMRKALRSISPDSKEVYSDLTVHDWSVYLRDGHLNNYGKTINTVVEEATNAWNLK